MRVHIIDYGLSNLLSVQRAVEAVGHTPVLCCEAACLRQAGAILLPGVGAFPDGMAGLNARGFPKAIQETVAAGTPLLGICLGMQMLFEESGEFGPSAGLGLLPGKVARIPQNNTDGTAQTVPQVGWNALVPPAGQDTFGSPLLAGTRPGSEVYFVHSYEAKPREAAHRLADTYYGGRRVCALVGSGQVFGAQFHPEKSGMVGLGILRAFFDGAASGSLAGTS